MGDIMYYVLQVASGTETKTEEHIISILPKEISYQCFHPTRHMRKKFHGKWTDIHEKLLPGYVFITTDNILEIYQQLKKVPMLTKLLGRDKGYFAELPPADVEWLEKVLELSKYAASNGYRLNQDAIVGAEYEAGLSLISIEEGSEIRIISGPLKNMGGMIKKINLHKRRAEVEVNFMNRKTVVYLGIELLERR